MNYTEKTKPGMGDPYWYESSVGLLYIVKMLNPDNHIKYVELQANVQLGLDDVVVTYDDGHTRFIQVKHTRANATLTFGNLVSRDQSNDELSEKRVSLLGELAESWEDAKDDYPNSEVYLFSNRTVGKQPSTAGPNRSIKRPALDSFWKELQEKALCSDEFTDISFPGYEEAWEEWCQQLQSIKNDDDRLRFLKNLHIITDQDDLKELGDTILKTLCASFSCSEQIAELLFGKLDHALRTWATSLRKSPRVDIEEVYKVLSISEDSYSYNQDLIPSDPFFSSRQNLVDQLENELVHGKCKVVFLSGVPGTGKTNIISKLCCKKESVVDIRYYAYEPIDPGKEYLPADVSSRVSAEVFWNTLLNQLRTELCGKLYKYRIPVLNSFMTLEEKRKEFLRIASEYAQDEHRVFVIAVDGLDHAARAGCVENTFLPTLPHPDYIPDGIKFLVAGQPKEDYQKYPIWLKQQSSFVKEFMIPGIQASDIHDLVEDKCCSLSVDSRQLITKIVCKYAEGNTLSAIFAVHEATQNGNPVEVEKNLRQRHLSGNIQEYYRNIWDEAKGNLGFLFVDYKIAGVFAFFNETISAEKLVKIFPEEGISKLNWNNILKSLRPLLVEKNRSYTILHNDVRVFLASFIGLDQDHVKEVYSALADYYIAQKLKTEGYYRDVIQFLKASDRANEFEKVYSPHYIVSAYVSGIELDELRVITDSLLEMVVREDNLNWNHLRNLTMGYMTLEQIEKCRYEIDDASFRVGKRVININPYECFVEPEKKWNESIITYVLKLVCTLFEQGEEARGRTLFHNWFSEMNFTRLKSYVIEEDDGVHTNGSKSVAELVGKVSTYIGEYSLISGMKTDSDELSEFATECIEQVLQNIFEIGDLELFSMALDSVEILLLDPLIVGIKKLIDENSFEHLRRLEGALGKRNITNPSGKMVYAFLQIINGTGMWSDEEAEELWQQIMKVKLPDDYIENLMSYYTIYAIVASYLQRKSRSSVASDVVSLYLAAHKNKNPQYYQLYFNCVCFLGLWIKSRNSHTNFYESVGDLTTLMENLYHKYWSPNDRDFETFYLSAYLLKGFILLAREENNSFQDEFENEIKRICSDNPANQLLDPGLMYYSDNTSRIQEWVDYWLDENGKVWSEKLAERNRIIKRFIASVKRYDQTDSIDFRGAVEKAKWSVIGFVSHKEYTVDIILSWYNTLVNFNEGNIASYSREVKNISDVIELVGDNRIEYSVNSKIYSDWGSLGFGSIQEVMSDNRYLSQCIEHPDYFVEVLIGYLKHADLSRKELVTIWGLGIGLLDWRNEDNHATISSLQKAIELRASENGIQNIKDDLCLIGPAYVDLVADPVKYIIPNRWCDSSYDAVAEENSENIIETYIGNTTEKSNSGGILNAIKNLQIQGKLDQELIERMIDHEFMSESYSIYQNSILEYLLGLANKECADKAIGKYLLHHLKDKYFYPAQDLPAIITWRISCEGEEYCRESVNELLNTYHCWLSAANHIKEPELEEGYNYLATVDLSASEIVGLYVNILLMIIRSEDADAARTALGGLFAVIQQDIGYASIIESKWDTMHYRAKEWLIMVYELCFALCPKARQALTEIISSHLQDDDFNVALYARILLSVYNGDNSEESETVEKKFFKDIPENGTKHFIELKENTPWITGYRCVLEQIHLLENRLSTNLGDLEIRTAEYETNVEPVCELLPLNRFQRGGCKVSCDNVNKAFYRVLYKDWYKGRWKYHEMDLARCILSASEPYYLVMSPKKWQWNGGKLFEGVEDILKEADEDKKIKINEVFNAGIDSDEIVLAGALIDYSYKHEFFGYCLSYIAIPGYSSKIAGSRFERNSRLSFIQRNDFYEKNHFNVTLHQNGIESFKNSNIMCGISKFALETFGWSEELGIEGVLLLDSNRRTIGRLDYYYTSRTDMGIRYSGNQPYIQRWVIKKQGKH